MPALVHEQCRREAVCQYAKMPAYVFLSARRSACLLVPYHSLHGTFCLATLYSIMGVRGLQRHSLPVSERFASETLVGELLDDEQSLISLAKRGEEQAYDALVRHYEQLAFRAAFLITRDEHDAAEVAQDAFLRAFRALGSFKLGHPFRPWLLKIVTNIALNRVVSRERRRKTEERYIRQESLASDPPFDNIVAEREEQQMLFRAVGSLSIDDQTLISLRYFLELPEADVAGVLGIPLGTVKSRLHRTLARLRKVIRRDFPELGLSKARQVIRERQV